jgi:hypothetical protein
LFYLLQGLAVGAEIESAEFSLIRKEK